MRASGVFDFLGKSGNLFIVLMGISGRPILKIMLMSNFLISSTLLSLPQVSNFIETMKPLNALLYFCVFA